ncbi:MAG TPA: pyridoxamine 5'-phosphate oxidase family protein [Acidimicrobiales bacterium]|nr:pyridoxamine 5'-phosphate oxidase family protein [Acidimicrobiales bacterium]
MGRTREQIDEPLAEWIAGQPIFFVATAPREGGHVNLSPKGYDSLRVLGPLEVAYLDLTGSGVETIAHLLDDGRITLMWCAFSGPPRIVRVQGRGEAVLADDPRYPDLAARFPDTPGARAVIRVDVDRIADSCGYAVPLMDLVGERDRLRDWAAGKGPDGLADYHAEKNATSIDGLPALGTLTP